MAVAEYNWPMHQPELPGYTGQVQVQHDVYEALDGNDIHETRWWVLPHVASASLLLKNQDEQQIFLSFYHITLREGQAWFNLALPFRTQLVVRVCHFVQGYSMTRLNQSMGNSFQVVHRVDFDLVIQNPGINLPPWG